LLLFGCSHNKGYTSKPAKSQSNQSDDLPEVNLVAYHLNDSITEVYYEVKNDNLLYRRSDTCLAFYADLHIFYKLLPEAGSKKIIDSSSFSIQNRSEQETVISQSLRTKFKIKTRLETTYALEVETLDRNKKTKYSSVIVINKLTKYNQQNFLIRVRDTVVFKNNFMASELVNVEVTNPAIKQVTVACFLKEFGPALPPFSVKVEDPFKFKPDSTFIIRVDAHQCVIESPPKGFYHLKTNAQGDEGITLHTYDVSFPGLGSTAEMINSTRYIMERTEFENCKDASEQKVAIDKFWLTLGGSNERARELLKRYYNRVLETNKFFTHYTQGWKSDRGMIYIVFGQPTNIYKGKKDEIWVYGNEANPTALRFVFNKTMNPYTDNEYVLERSQFYKDAWYSAVDYWRQGTIYTEEKR
jgi:GWxTD domain-containing protein